MGLVGIGNFAEVTCGWFCVGWWKISQVNEDFIKWYNGDIDEGYFLSKSWKSLAKSHYKNEYVVHIKTSIKSRIRREKILKSKKALIEKVG